MDVGRLVPREMKAVRYNHKFSEENRFGQNTIFIKVTSERRHALERRAALYLITAVYNLKQNAKREITQSVSLGISMIDGSGRLIHRTVHNKCE
jgi:hypothetical protein